MSGTRDYLAMERIETSSYFACDEMLGPKERSNLSFKFEFDMNYIHVCDFDRIYGNKFMCTHPSVHDWAKFFGVLYPVFIYIYKFYVNNREVFIILLS